MMSALVDKDIISMDVKLIGEISLTQIFHLLAKLLGRYFPNPHNLNERKNETNNNHISLYLLVSTPSLLI